MQEDNTREKETDQDSTEINKMQVSDIYKPKQKMHIVPFPIFERADLLNIK